MPFYRYHWLAVVQLVLLVAVYILFWRSIPRYRSPLFTMYCSVWTAFSMVRFVTSLLRLWRADWNAYWLGAAVMNLLAFLVVLKFGFDRINVVRLLRPPGDMLLIMACFVFAVIFIRYWSASSTRYAIRFVESGCTTWIAGISGTVWIYFRDARSQRLARHYWLGNGMSRPERILLGIVILYCGSTLTTWWWAFHPHPWPEVWLVEAAVQSLALGWWLWNSR